MKPKRLKSAPEDENTPPGPAVAVWGKKKSAFRCKRGVFSKILRELPEEIEYEIFSHLDSASFLNLAMSCKFLWKKYTAPEKSRFWARCRQNAGLPDCPPHLTERAFAHLVYMKCCHQCGKPRVSRIIWVASARYCDACVNQCMVGFRAFFEDSANEEMRDFESLLPTVKVNDRLSFSLAYLERLVGKWKDAKTENLSWEAFEAGQREHLQALSAHVETCKRWKKAADVARAQERRRLHDQRYSLSTLLATGYEEALLAFADSKLRQLKQVHGTAHLDNKGWAKMEPQVIKFMDNMQVAQVFEERIQKFARYFGQVKEEHLHDEDISWWPGTVDLLLMQGTSYRTRLTTGSMEELEIDLPALKTEIRRDVSRWLLEKKAELEDIIRDLKPDVYPEDVQAVELAVCVLRCYGCGYNVRYPEVLVHRCSRGYDCSGGSWDWAIQKQLQLRDDVFEQTVIETLGYCPWSAGEDAARHLRRSKNEQPVKTMFTPCGPLTRSKAMETVQSCGKDPLRATWKEMDECNPIFSQPTSPLGTGVTVMSWRYAVTTMFLFPDGLESQGDWKVDDPDLPPAARVAVTKEYRLEEQGVRTQPIFCCARCPDPFLARMTYAEAVDHVSKSHAKEGASIEGGDIYCNPHHWAMWASPMTVE